MKNLWFSCIWLETNKTFLLLFHIHRQALNFDKSAQAVLFNVDSINSTLLLEIKTFLFYDMIGKSSLFSSTSNFDFIVDLAVPSSSSSSWDAKALGGRSRLSVSCVVRKTPSVPRIATITNPNAARTMRSILVHPTDSMPREILLPLQTNTLNKY